jgi:cysteine-rich repeat protein
MNAEGGDELTSVCGNGLLEASEGCDDGNERAGDGCGPTCAVEDGFECSGSRSACNRSCVGLAKICGPNRNSDCCASNVVTGGTFNRSNDPNFPATVSDFRLDTYEISAGRFKHFVADYRQDMIAEGAGANPNNPSDTGWDPAWTASLPSNSTTLISAIQCHSAYQAWTAGRDNLPMNCIDWFQAEAFCIWDGGRLPTEAEWNYAAAGGSSQWLYPWGNTAPDCSFANYHGASDGADFCLVPGAGSTSPVGSLSPNGDGKFGQADLAGNVWEWLQDWAVDPYTNPSHDGANLTVSDFRAIRGGNFGHNVEYLLTSHRDLNYAAVPSIGGGARCARSR